MTTQQQWISAGRADDLDDTDYHVVDHDNGPVLLCRPSGSWQAFSMICPHKSGVMRLVDVRDGVLGCPFHAWLFNLSDGGREQHDYGCLTEYPVQVTDDVVTISCTPHVTSGE